MPRRRINLTAEQDAFIKTMVEADKYQSASEAVRDAVRGWQQRCQEDVLKLVALRSQITAGIDALDHGAYTEIDDADLDAELDKLAGNRPG